MSKYHSTVFSQLLNFIPKDEFGRLVGQHQGDRYTKSCTSWNQLVLQLYAHATEKDSLRDIETSISLDPGTHHHLGINTIARSTLSYANNHRSSQIFEQLFYATLTHCQRVVPNGQFTFDQPLYSLDSTTIKLCLSLCTWATYTQHKGALKLHTLLSNDSMLPELMVPTTGKTGDITAAKRMELTKHLKKGSILVFDRAYTDYAWWQELTDAGLTFVARTKKNQSFVVSKTLACDTGTGVLKDELVTHSMYPGVSPLQQSLRQVTFYDTDTETTLTFLTNNTELPATTIAAIYKQRWQIELFFKWIKQNLKIKAFLGTSENAVLTQVWIAMLYYLLLSYIKYQTKFARPLLTLTRMIGATLLNRRPLIDLLSLTPQTIHRFKPPPDLQPRLGLGF
jgi:putative transposase